MILNQGWGTPDYAYARDHPLLSPARFCIVPPIMSIRITSKHYDPQRYGCYFHICATHANVYNARPILNASSVLLHFLLRTLFYSHALAELSVISARNGAEAWPPISYNYLSQIAHPPRPYAFAHLCLLHFQTSHVSLPTNFFIFTYIFLLP